MGLFTSLFGSTESDQADRLRQEAINAFNSIRTPELQALQVQLDKYVSAGQITPEQAEATLLNSNAFDKIKTDPSLVGAQKQALQQLQDVANKGGLTALDRSKIQDITDTQNQENRSSNEALMNNARARGIGGSELSLVNQMIGEQGSANRASRAGMDVAAQSEARALQALQAAGALGGTMEAQQYGEQANRAQSQNAIDKFNADTANSFNQHNIDVANAAQAANVGNAQNVANMNTTSQNAGKQYNAQQNQNLFNDEMAKASGKAGVMDQWAQAAQNQKNMETGADLGLTSGLISAGATAFGGPVAGMFAGQATKKPAGYNPNITEDMLPSDKNLKTGIKDPDEAEFEQFMSDLKPKIYRLKENVQPNAKPQMGIIAQDAEKSPLGAEIVQNTPDGKMIDHDKAISAALGSLANLHQRVSELEGK